ncbi:MAG TPA: alpha/beta hydrolase [Rhizomicrobium sp.]|jgi:pimeloyl-ACP methyl ester carboxylesterase|nr:alpha/beta hydrolase [Rhizomicrobium sp.]
MKIASLALAAAALIGATIAAQADVKTIVLVHGAFADGSGWKPVAKILEQDGYAVQIVQEPETSFKDDVAATKLVLDKAGPCVLVGHSYGGMIITEAGNHANVKSLVYVAAYQPDVGESAGALNAKMPAAAHSIAPVGGGFLAVNQDAFPGDFAADLPRSEARFMAISQVPVAAETLGAGATVAAWKNKPAYAVVATQDRMINPDLERFMYKRSHSRAIELSGSHAIFLSHPAEVAALIEKAAKASN